MPTKVYSGSIGWQASKTNANYATCHDGTAGLGAGGMEIINLKGANYQISRAAAIFDYSVDKLPAGAVVTAVTLNLKYLRLLGAPTNPGWFLNVVSGNGIFVPGADFYQVLLGHTTVFGAVSDALFDGGDHDVALNAAGIADTQSQVISPFFDQLQYGLRMDRDVNSEIPLAGDFSAGDIGDVTHLPTLTIAYTTGGNFGRAKAYGKYNQI